MDQPYRRHLATSDDLVTAYENIRAGFVALALERNCRATPFVEQARALKAVALHATTPGALAEIEEIQPALLTAAGLSDKAVSHLRPEDKAEAIQGLIANFLEPAGSAFVEELVYRYLLTRGDTLGGSLRNVGGSLAQRKLTRAILAALTLMGRSYEWLHGSSKAWLPMPDDEGDVELTLRGMAWKREGWKRTILYNLTVPLVKNNVDLCLFDCAPSELQPGVFRQPERYVVFGELKGGIDPAGADEHWKTARTALTRIRQAFAAHGLSPHTFFIGAAIEKRMAEEIWGQLEDGLLSNAANLTVPDQIASLCHWLIDT